MILRISDLSSVLNRGKSSTGETISWGSIEDAIAAFHDALDPKLGSNATDAEKAALSSMLFEVSYPNGDSTYKSKNIQYAFLSGDIQYDVLHSKAPFYEVKNFLSGFNVSGDVNFNVNKFNLSSNAINLSSNAINLSSNVIDLSGNTIKIYGKDTFELIYHNDLLIKYDPDGTRKNLQTIATFSSSSGTPTVTFKTDKGNPIHGTAEHALWS